MEIQHPLHQHPLKLVPMGSEEDEDGQTRKRACAGCDNVLYGEVYACDSCSLYLHQSCADLPLRIAHLVHPGCTLFLKLVQESEDGGEPQGMMLWYRCEACNFGIDAGCGQQFLQNNSSKEVEDAKPSSKEKDDAEPSSEEVGDAELKYCRVCNKLISESYNDCNSAYEYFFHKSCVVTHPPRKIQHFFHQCTLFLSLREGKVCSACKSDDDVFIYHCKKCNYSMHERCAMFQPISRQDEGKRVQHWSHHHPLKLSEKDEVLGRTLQCKVCRTKISWQSDFAACEPCDFHIHESCISLPLEIQHRCHPDTLFLQHNTNPHFCNTCLSLVDDFHYKCKKCIFRMHLNCAYSSREVGQVDKVEHILHFCHHHPLQLFNDPKKEKTDFLKRRKLECLVCECSASGLTFGCKDCDVYLHKSCLDILPQTIRVADVSLFLCKGKDVRCTRCRKLFSGFHFQDRTITMSETMWCVPCALLKALSVRVVYPSYIFSQLHFHPCTLTLKLFPSFTCNGCFTHCHTNAWYCDQCDFYVGIKCAQISMRGSSDGNEWIQHFCHCHPLQVSQDTEEDSTTSCKICGDRCTPRPFYFCSDCDFHIHKSCLDILPQKIDKHYFNCSLVLLTTSSYICIACQKENDSGLAFRSIQSGFKLCMKCVIWPENIQNDDGTFTSVHHWHQLTFVDKSEKDANCLLCTSNVSTSTYYCSECKDYFHKACAELPLEVQHPLHKQHPLALTSGHLLRESSRNCSLCEGDLLINDPKSRHSGVYHCKECGFQLDKKCFTSFPSIQYQGHSHLLTVVEDMQGQEDCHVCKKSCRNKMVFRCAEVECKFSLHLSCGPLPCNIKHSCHVHPLILEEFYVEENYTDLFPCHFCEERRDPRLPVYRCGEGCPMICDIKCVISEVLPKLLGAHGEVELRTTFPNVVSKVITTKDEGVIDIANDSDTRFTRALEFLLDGPHSCEVMRVIKNWEGIMSGSRGTELELETDEMFTFSKEAFSQFSSKLECTQFTLEREGIPDFISQHSGSVGSVEHIILPDTLIPIYEEWFGKFRRISTTCKFDRYKSVFVFMLCAVFHDMRTTKLVDVTNERVLQWVTLLKLVEESGCTIGFISDKIKRVWEAHFLIKAKAIVDDKSARLDRRHKELSRREEELLRELKEVRKEKEEVNKEEQVHHKYAGDGMRSLRKEYADALLIKWKPATVVISECKDQLRDKLEFRGSKNLEELLPKIYPKVNRGIYDLEKGSYMVLKSSPSRG